ncbi:MAG: Ig-like domain-containing protein, partial [Terracidiphilus sp.]
MFATLQATRLRVLLVAGLIAVTSLSLCQLANAQTTASNEWTWMGGSVGNGLISGVYSGGLGAPAATDIPGSRNSAASWTGANGNFWLFGGYGTDASSNSGYLNDLWKFEPSLGTYGEWAWMGGSSAMSSGGYGYGQPGTHGTLGTPSAANVPGGRESAATWTDSSGNLWLFGGYGLDGNGISGQLNDLWKFNPSLGLHGEWTWMGGNNILCCDSDGYPQPGTYGGLGVAAASYVPGGREGASSWTDLSGNLWLFGGYGYDASGNEGYLNDLWEFNPSLGTYGEWAWMGGSNTVPGYNDGQSGVYGTPETPVAGNIPGGRDDASSWTDSNGNLWLFGGNGYDSGGTGGWLNDLWEFNPSLGTYGEWAWMGGKSSLTCFLQGTYPKQRWECRGSGTVGALGTPASGNIPVGRSLTANWTDSSGNFWLFGGYGACPQFVETVGYFVDLWEFSPSTNEWAWMGGYTGNSGGQQGVYGTLGSPAAGNLPGARASTMTWTDSSGNFWLFGGNGDPGGTGWYNAGNLNDLWVYQPPITRPTMTVTLSAPSITAAQELTATVAVTGEDGTPTPTGSVTLSGGGYTSTATVLTGGGATINIPAGSLTTGTQTLTAIYAPDSSSSSTYAGAAGTAAITVTIAPQTISFPAIAGTQYALTSVPLSATATSGLPVSFSSSTPTI